MDFNWKGGYFHMFCGSFAVECCEIVSWICILIELYGVIEDERFFFVE
jgi:hypothetical protein